jgi:quercetin dioxygenase-like cupin family protein
MKIRTNYAAREHVTFESVSWVQSPDVGVERKMLERDGDEVARATSIVRYAPGSAFAEHVHDRGEEFFVLAGVFQDEHGDYPAGTYVRNPPGSKHRPSSQNGCTIFVKLRQFAEGDTLRRVVGSADGTWMTQQGQAAEKELHAFASERVSLVELTTDSTIVLSQAAMGIEILVIRGYMEVFGARCAPLTWVRCPGTALGVRSESGCLFWSKCGHLPAGDRVPKMP